MFNVFFYSKLLTINQFSSLLYNIKNSEMYSILSEIAIELFKFKLLSKEIRSPGPVRDIVESTIVEFDPNKVSKTNIIFHFFELSYFFIYESFSISKAFEKLSKKCFSYFVFSSSISSSVG